MRIFRYMLIYIHVSCTFETFHCWLISKNSEIYIWANIKSSSVSLFPPTLNNMYCNSSGVHGSLNHKMDRTFWLLMVAACVCGSYRNSSQLPEPYTENLSRSVGNERNERAYSVPHYVHEYKEIISGGTWYFGHNLKFLHIA